MRIAVCGLFGGYALHFERAFRGQDGAEALGLWLLTGTEGVLKLARERIGDPKIRTVLDLAGGLPDKDHEHKRLLTRIADELTLDFTPQAMVGAFEKHFGLTDRHEISEALWGLVRGPAKEMATVPELVELGLA